MVHLDFCHRTILTTCVEICASFTYFRFIPLFKNRVSLYCSSIDPTLPVTEAICWKCGESKFGGFAECPQCEAVPSGEDDLMFSLFLTDHYLSKETMMEYQQRIRNGANLVLDDETRNLLRPSVVEASRIMGIPNSGISSDSQEGIYRGKEIRQVRPTVLGQRIIQFCHLTALFVLYIAIKMTIAGNPLAILGAGGYYWMINTVSVMISSVIFSDYPLKSRIGQLLVGITFLFLSVLLMYLGNYDRITIHPDSAHPTNLFLWVAAPALGIVVGFTGGGRTKRQ